MPFDNTNRDRSALPLLTAPEPRDGLRLWQLACTAGSLDVNSRYSYHLWCRDFAETSVAAKSGSSVIGFVTGYRPSGREDRVFVWQVAVHPDHRGRGLGVAMLDHLASRTTATRFVEATVTPSNVASARMFERFATGWNAEVLRAPFLRADDFPAGHEEEILFQIGPLEHSS